MARPRRRSRVARCSRACARIRVSTSPKSRRSRTAFGGISSASASAKGITTRRSPAASHRCRACHASRSGGAPRPLASARKTARVWSGVSETGIDSSRVSFSGMQPDRGRGHDQPGRPFAGRCAAPSSRPWSSRPSRSAVAPPRAGSASGRTPCRRSVPPLHRRRASGAGAVRRSRPEHARSWRSGRRTPRAGKRRSVCSTR